MSKYKQEQLMDLYSTLNDALSKSFGIHHNPSIENTVLSISRMIEHAQEIVLKLHTSLADKENQ